MNATAVRLDGARILMWLAALFGVLLAFAGTGVFLGGLLIMVRNEAGYEDPIGMGMAVSIGGILVACFGIAILYALWYEFRKDRIARA